MPSATTSASVETTYGYVSFERILLVIRNLREPGRGGPLPLSRPYRPPEPGSTAADPGVALNVSCAGGPSDRLTIAQVTPHPWGARHEVNEFVARVSAELADRGHRVVIAAPSDSRREVRESRRAIAAAEERPASLFGRRGAAGARPRHRDPAAARARARARRRCRSTSAGRSRACSAGSTSTSSTSTTRSRPASPRRRCATRARSTSAASTSPASAPSRPRWRGRWSRSSSAGSTRARPAAATEELIERFFPGHYERVEPGADARVEPWWPGAARRAASARLRIAFCLDEESGRPAAVPARDPPPRSGRRLGGGGLGRRLDRGPHRAAPARARRAWSSRASARPRR